MIDAKVLEAHFDTAFDAPDGIKKLRELILTLAMQGKLVPQDPKDEPASELLKKIEAEKKKLVNEGKIKDKGSRGGNTGSREDAKTQSVEGPYELPKGWVWTALSGIVQILNGRAYKQNELLEVGTPVLRVGNLFTSNRWYYSDLELDPDKYINDGDLIFAWSASFGPFIWNGGKVIYHYHIWKLPLHSELNIEKSYLFQYLQSVTAEIKRSGNGIAMMHMTKERMEVLPIPLPPLAEQKRIVAKIDQLMAHCDELEKMREERNAKRLAAHAAAIRDLISPSFAPSRLGVQNFLFSHFFEFYSVRENVAELRKAILQLAVMGKLVPQDPKDQPASELLKEIQEEKLTRSREGAKGRKNTGLREDAKSQSVEGPYELPKGWVWTRLDEIVDISSGVTKGRNLYGKKIVVLPYLSVANVQRGYLTLDSVKEIEISVEEIDRFSLRNRDLLLTEGGDWDKVGRTAIWNNQIEPCLHQNHIFRARIWLASQNEFWLENFLNSTPCREYFASASKQTTNLASINKTQLMNCPIALPPFAEQKRIVARIDQLMSLCDELEKQIDATTQKQTELLSSLVSAV